MMLDSEVGPVLYEDNTPALYVVVRPHLARCYRTFFVIGPPDVGLGRRGCATACQPTVLYSM